MSERQRHSPEPQNVKPKSVALDVHTALTLLVASYDHSQGSTHLQKLIFAYLHLICAQWRIRPATRQAVIAAAKTVIPRLLAIDGFHGSYAYQTTASGIQSSIDEEAQAFASTLQSRRKSPTLDALLSSMVAQMLHLDYLWIVKSDEGRHHRNPSAAKNGRYSPRHDPYLSYLCYYGLEGHPTGVAVFDQMYQDIQAYVVSHFFTQPDEDSWRQEDFAEMLDTYQEWHPLHHIRWKLPSE